ncbi:hypothetical protein [Prescottella equi]|uniref:hypothetical protein n=1 Tax=Rhodococcus hoagii TaxID=43767 RepID=UPI000D0F757F|nr:hypothetical protein [Prescottella equi]AVP71325.1 hypothetical protein C7H75_24905 [Prescottella equi]
MTAPTTAAQLATATEGRAAEVRAAHARAIVEPYVDPLVTLFSDRYDAELTALTERGGMAGIRCTGGNFLAIEGTAGLSPDNRVMFFLATNTIEGGLADTPDEGNGWAVGLYDADTDEMLAHGDDADITVAHSAAFARLRGRK